MTNKVTNYSLSQQLHALGFESESHCGWYIGCLQEDLETIKWHFSLKHVETDSGSYKAYDCFDLLMWLKDYSSLDRDREGKYYYDGESRYARDYASFCFDKFNQKWIYDYPRWSDDNQTVWSTEAEDPTTALALAIIEILKEREDV